MIHASKPETFELIKQPPGSKLCGAAICAMVTGQSLDAVMDQVDDWRTLTTPYGVVEFLSKRGITMGTIITGVSSDRCLQTPLDLYVDLTGHPAILSVMSRVFKGLLHWVFWDGEKILDPSEPQDEYDIVEIWPLYYWEPIQIDHMDQDWQAELNAPLQQRVEVVPSLVPYMSTSDPKLAKRMELL